MAEAKKYLDLQGLATYNGKIKGYVNEKENALDAKITAAAKTAQDDINALEGLVGTLPEGASTTVTGYIGKVAADLIALDGSLANVAKSGAAADVSIADEGGKITATTVEGALAELANAINATSKAGAVTCEKSSPDGVAARYIFKQDGKEIPNAVIDIPKDMVVESGEVLTNPVGQPAGTYIVLTLANKEESKLYINVTDLIEYVTGGETDEIAVAVSAEHVATAIVKKIAATKIIYKEAVGETSEVSVAAALNDIYDQIGKGGSVSSQISAAIAGLDATVNQLGTGENGTGLTLQVIETDGRLTAVTGSINTITGEDINKLFETTAVEG